MTSLAEIQVFAFAEPGLKETLDAYANCTRPAGWDLSYTAAVTPAPVDVWEVRMHHAEIAADHDVFVYRPTPPGKLASRNTAHNQAVQRGADVIVAGDADAPPLDDDYFIELLEWFDQPEVVATNARPVATGGPIAVLTNAAGWAHDLVVPHMNGQGHAIAVDAWTRAGPFSEQAELERDVKRVRLEEEFEFRKRLEAVGRVVDTGARVHNDTRRTKCRLRRALGMEPGPYCRRLGTHSFAPRGR